MSTRSALIAGIVGVVVGGLLMPLSAATPRGSITIERISEIKTPSSAAWSPDGQRIGFLWDAAGKQDLFVVSPGGQPMALTDLTINPEMLQSDIGNWAWLSNDRIVFSSEGALWTVAASTPGRVTRLPGINGDDAFDLSRERQQIVYARQGQLYFSSLERPYEVRLTNLPEEQRASSPRLSRDGRFVSFTASRAWTENVNLPYNGTRIRAVRNVTAERRLGIVAVHGGQPIWIPAMGDTSVVDWTASGELLYEETSPDRKTRAIKVTTLDGIPRTIWSDTDPAWWSPTRGPATVVSPDGTRVAFFSDRTGWTHLYVAPTTAASAKEAKQLTTGEFTTGYPAWSPDSRRIAFGHGERGNQMERLLSIVDVETGRAEPLVTARGVSTDPRFSADGNRLLFLRTSVEHGLEVYSTTVPRGAAPQSPERLTNSMPAGLETKDLTAPVAVSFPSRVDGKQVPATLMASKSLDRSQKHPAIVWIHGSGSDQNYLGWHPGSYRMYYSVHQYFAQQGYVILTPDYRGSSGYDRDWATGNYLDLGGKDYLDVASGADYLKTLPYVDPDRIGVWGLSYGGFMTLQAVTVTPTLFRAAIDVAGVTDWAPRPGGWTVARMETPAEHPEVYHASAPVKHIEKLVQPLLILHGTNDTNVAFQDSLILFDRLLKLGKPFESAIYPGETHFFRRAYVLRDAWRRSEEFFNRHLKGGPAGE